MDPTQHPILSIFEEDTHIDMKAPFNDIDLLRFNKIITNLVLENFGQDFELFETIRANLRSIVDKMNERKDNGSIPSNASNELLNHNRLYCVNNKHLINFDEAYEYTGEDLVEFLNTKWRVNKEKKVQYTEEDLVSKNLESKESEIDEVEDTNGEDNVENSNDEKNVEDTNEEENVENSNDEDNVENSNEEENVENKEVEETKEAEEVRTFRSGRKVARTATSGKPEDDEKDIPTDKEQLEESENNDKPAKRTVKEIEPSVKRTLRRGRTRGTIVDDPPEVDNKDASPPRTRRTLRSRK
ncbi:hypothetical protein ACO0OL_003452 [Hanseniaspora opuntiae]